MNEQEPETGRHRTLAEAQALLMARRAALREARKGQSESPAFGDPPHPGQQKTRCEKRETENGNQFSPDSQQYAQLVAGLPEHLGWASATQTAVLRAAAKRRGLKQTTVNSQQPTINNHPPTDNGRPPARKADAPQTVSLPPSLGLAVLRNKKAAGARLWLLLRAIDTNGSGMVPLDRARKAFTAEASRLRFCGKRQLRNLFSAGEGLFWRVDGQRIWLRSAVRVAHSLGLDHFRGQDVAIPISELTGGIGKVRANLYAAFHSGRDAAPVSRRTLARESGIAPRTQRHYDHQSGIHKEANYASGPALGSPEAEELAWYHGPAAFAWRDRRKGRDGKKGRFLAWQLPNSYHGPHTRLGRGRRKRQNKALADLLHTGTAGNDQSPIDNLTPRYFADARAASRAFTRESRFVYWPAITPGVWHCLYHPSAGRTDGNNNREWNLLAK